jgi:RimJ/RimL family protein N-acetyltransferase
MTELVSSIKIRPFKISDLNDVNAYASNPKTTKYMLWGPNTIEDTQNFLNYVLSNYQKDPVTHFEYGIEYQGKIIGGIGLIINYENNSAEIGWILNEAYQRQGFTYEAAKQMIEIARSLGVKSIHATADSRNVASYKLMEKLGMVHISTSKGTRLNKETNQYELDQVYYEMLL